jgi:hypothetical protein
MERDLQWDPLSGTGDIFSMTWLRRTENMTGIPPLGIGQGVIT